MKMTPAHVAHIRAAVAAFYTDFHRSRYAAAGLSDTRFRWDCLRAAGLMPWLCDTLYTYLNDVHIETALRAVIKPLQREPAARIARR